MGEKGTVLDIKGSGSIAVIAFNRTEACAKCKACVSGFVESQMILEARNDAGAKTGDTVLIELPQNGLLTASVIMYLFPLIAMLAGFFAGGLLAPLAGVKSEVFAFCVGLGLMVLSFLLIRVNEDKFKSLPLFLPYVTEIAHSAAKEENS